MKTSLVFFSAAAAFAFATPSAQAGDLLGSMLDQPANAGGSHPRGRSASPAKGLQLAGGLQTSGPLNGSGPAPIAVRLSEDDWRKVFPRKEPVK